MNLFFYRLVPPFRSTIGKSVRTLYTKATIINGNIKNIKHTNLSYIELHRVIIKGITFPVFNYSKTIYIGNLRNSIEINELESFIKLLN